MKSHSKGNMPPAMILCGGKGTRLREVTELLPKPMVPVGEQPIVWHIMKTYAAFGVRRFILCLGYKQETFIDYFMNFHMRLSDSTITLGHNPKIVFHEEIDESDWEVTLAQTGLESFTGKRVAIASKYLRKEDENFFLTYGDGLSDIDVGKLYRSHLKSGKMFTISAVHPAARFGEMHLDGDRVENFDEKTAVSAGYINGGFMAVNRKFIEKYLSRTENEFFERRPMGEAIGNGEVHAFRHEGFWQCMDTPREYQLLNDLWESGKAPWTRFWDK